MNVNKEQISMSELENVNGGVGCKKKKKLFLITGKF